jgi:hypothetical protein
MNSLYLFTSSSCQGEKLCAYFSAALARSRSAVRGGNTEWRCIRPIRVAAPARSARATNSGACLRPHSWHIEAVSSARTSRTPPCAAAGRPHKLQGSFVSSVLYSSKKRIMNFRLAPVGPHALRDKSKAARSIHRPICKKNRTDCRGSSVERRQYRAIFRTRQILRP